MDEQPLPKGLRISSIIYYVLAGLQVGALVGYGFILLFIAALSGQTIGELVEQTSKNTPFSAPIIIAFLVLIAVFIAGMAVLDFYIGKGLGTGKAWARTVAIIFSAMALIGGVLSLFISGISTLLTASADASSLLMGGLANIPSLLITFGVHGTVLYFLLWNNEVKEFFSQGQKSNR